LWREENWRTQRKTLEARERINNNVNGNHDDIDYDAWLLLITIT
jgi:hypothetical protein